VRARRVGLGLLITVSVVAALQRVTDGLSCLVLSPLPQCGIDLLILRTWVLEWFGGAPGMTALYPPGSLAMLWLFVGWSPAMARWVWAAASLAALTWMSWIVARESGATTGAERVFAALWPWAIYATRGTLVNGQLGLVVLSLLVTGVLGARRSRGCWLRDTATAFALLGAFMKPATTIPFVPLIFLGVLSLRPAVLAALGYGAVTAIALALRDAAPFDALYRWATTVIEDVPKQSGFGVHGNVHVWLTLLGLETWHAPATLAILVALVWWIARHRDADTWCLLGVAAIAARMWTYHRIYDDTLLLLPMVALYRLTRSAVDQRQRMAARIACALLWLGAMTPARLFLLAWPGNEIFMAGLVATWLVALVTLLAITPWLTPSGR
jgi:Glycosyltransferase family 87